MFNLLDKLTQYPSFWLGVYICGSGMVIATIAGTAGAVAAGSATGFFLLAGTFGYESLTRRGLEEKIGNRVSRMEQTQEKMHRDLSRTRNDVDLLKDDMSETAQTLNREVHKILNQNEPAARAPAQAMRLMQKSFERMGNKTRDTQSFMPQQAPANEVEHAHAEIELKAPARTSAAQSKTQKYKDLLLMAASRQKEMVTEERSEPQFTQPAPEYSDTVIAELINHAIENERIEIFAQPIVKLPSRRLQYLELFARIRARSGIYLTAENYRPMAEKETKIENVDHLLLLHVLETVRNDTRRGIDIGYFINISSRCLKDKNYMTDLLEFVRMRRELAPHLVFELQYADIKNLSPACFKMIDGLSHIGCKFSVDNISDSNFNADDLAEKGFSFLKFNASKLMEMCSSARGEMEVARMKSALDKSRLTLIVEKLETEHDLKELLDFEIDLGEGYLFGRPDLEMAYRPRRQA
jgi:cyclic-di-GMP phosphodiesterase TipF (flagellum assembly factor)